MNRSSVSSTRGAFFGRAAELDALDELDGRAIWLSGPPGVGKTRLAREHAGRRAPASRPPLQVDLSAATDQDDVLAALASSLDLPPPDGPSIEDRAAALGAALRHLGVGAVVLDDADRCADAAAQLARWLVRAAPETAVLVTARERRAESADLACLDVTPLEVPGEGDEDADAVRFFRACVCSLGTDHLAGVPADVAHLVRVLDGIPLALELAAFRMNVLSPRDLAARVEQSAAVLGDPRGLDPRHRSLLGAVEASWELLDEEERSCLAALSILQAPFDAELAEAASPLGPPGTLEALASLRRRNLLADAGSGRFALLTSVREFAALHLAARERAEAITRVANNLARRAERWLEAADRHADEAAVRDLRSHRAHFDLVLASPGASAMELVRARLAIARLEGTFERDAPRFASDDARLALERGRGFAEANQFERAIVEFEAAAASDDPDVRAEALADQAFSLLFIDEVDRATDRIAEATGLAPRGSLAECRATLTRAGIAHTFGQREEARALYESALRLARRRQDHRSAARAMQNLGVFYTDESRFDLGRRFLLDAIAHNRAFGDRFREAWGYNSLGVLELRARRREEAVAALRSARGLFEAIGLRTGAASVLANLAMIALDFEDAEAARDYALDAVALSDFEEDGYVRATSNLCLAMAYWFLGRKHEAGLTFDALEQTVAAVAHIQLVVSWLVACAAFHASNGDERAEALFDRAEAALAEVGGDRTLERTLAISRLHLGLRKYRDEAAVGARDAATTLFATLDAMRDAHEEAFSAAHTSEPLRYSVRLLRLELPDAARALHDADVANPDALVVSRELQAFRPRGGAWVPLARSPSLWRLFEALVDAQLRATDAALDLEQLQEAVWPGELLTPESAANRLYVSITKLRKGGLAGHLDKNDHGYRLCGAQVLVAETGGSPLPP